jgi:hypothetical protein
VKYGGIPGRVLSGFLAPFVSDLLVDFEPSRARSEYGHDRQIACRGQTGFEGSSSGSPLAKRRKDCLGEGEGACLPDGFPNDPRIVVA